MLFGLKLAAFGRKPLKLVGNPTLVIYSMLVTHVHKYSMLFCFVEIFLQTVV